jgi:hypothetical protein
VFSTHLIFAEFGTYFDDTVLDPPAQPTASSAAGLAARDVVLPDDDYALC